MKINNQFGTQLLAVVLFAMGCGGSSKTVDVSIQFANQALFNAANACAISESFDWATGVANQDQHLGRFRAVVIYPEGNAEYFPLPGVSFDVTGFAAAATGAALSDYIQFPTTIKVPVIPGNNRRIVIEGAIYHHASTSSCTIYQASAPPAANCGGTCLIRGNIAPIVFAASSAAVNISGSSGSVAITAFEAFDSLRGFHRAAEAYLTAGNDKFTGYGLDGYAKSQLTANYVHENMPTLATAANRPVFLNTGSPFSWLRIRINNSNAVISPAGSYLGISLKDYSNQEMDGFLPFPLPAIDGKRMLGFSTPTSPVPTFQDSMQSVVLHTATAAAGEYKFVKIWPLLPGRKYQVQFWGSLSSGNDTTPASGSWWNGSIFAAHSSTTANIVPGVKIFGSSALTSITRVGVATCIKCNVGLPTVAATCVDNANTQITTSVGSYPCSSSPYFSFSGCVEDTDDCR